MQYVSAPFIVLLLVKLVDFCLFRMKHLSRSTAKKFALNGIVKENACINVSACSSFGEISNSTIDDAPHVLQLGDL